LHAFRPQECRSNELIEFVESDIKGIVPTLRKTTWERFLGPSEKFREGDIATPYREDFLHHGCEGLLGRVITTNR
jgi:hypothetical protein